MVKLIAKFAGRVTLALILPVEFQFYRNYNTGVYFTGKIDALLLE